MAYTYSSSPTYITSGQSLKIRYNSPNTWDTDINPIIQVKIGNTTGTWLLGNRAPRTTVQQFTFLDNTIRASATGSVISGTIDDEGWPTHIEKNTLYYSNIVTIGGLANLSLDYSVPIKISTSDSGATVSGYDAQYRLKAPGGSWGSWRNTPGTLTNGWQVQLRMRTANAYTSTRNITITIGFDGNPSGQGEWPWNEGPFAVDNAYSNYAVSDTWTLTTRQQDVVVDQFVFNDLGFDSAGNVLVSEYVTGLNTFYYESFTLTGIDDDALIRVRVKTGKTKYKNDTETNLSGVAYFAVAEKTGNDPPAESSTAWKTELTGMMLNDAIWVRLKSGNYTTQRRVTVEAYALVSDGNNTSGSVTDEWKVRTETDKYPDQFEIGPLYAISDGDNVNVNTGSDFLTAEPGFTYYGEITLAGFGFEYDGSVVVTTGNSTGQLQVSTSSQPAGTAYSAATYGNSVSVTNGTRLFFKIVADTNWNIERSGIFSINGIQDTMTIKTRPAKIIPYPWTFLDTFWPATGGVTTTFTKIQGIEADSVAEIVDQNVSNALLSRDGITWNASVALQNNDTLRCKISNPTTYGVLNEDGDPNFTFATVRIGGAGAPTETYNIYPSNSNDYRKYYKTPGIYEFEVPDFAPTIFFDISGAGGGQGGDDAPNSYGGPGGIGIRITGTMSNINPGTIIQLIVPGKGSNGNDFATGASGGAGGSGYYSGGEGGNAGSGDKSGGGGGGGGAACIRIKNGDILVIAGGGGGGAGAGNDTKIPTNAQYGNYNNNGNYSPGSLSTNLSAFSNGDNGGDVSAGQQGGGGGGGGAGNSNAGLAGTNDSDAKSGTGGGAYYNSSYFEVAPTISTTTGAPAEVDGYIAFSHPQQDVTPDPFAFDNQSGLEFSTVITSNKQQITGITGNTAVQTSGGLSEFRILDENGDPLPGNASNWQSGVGAISNEQTLQVRATTSSEPNYPLTISVVVGSTTVYWVLTTRGPDDTNPVVPDIPPKLDQNRDVAVYSDEITITGINVPVTASVDAGEFRVCNLDGQCTAYDNTDKTVENGYTIQLKLQSSPDYNAPTTMNLTVGDAPSVEFLVKTIVAPTTNPVSFVFDNQTVPPSTLVTSTVEGVQDFYITGMSTPVPIYINTSPSDAVDHTDVEIYINDVKVTSKNTSTGAPTIASTDKLYLKYTTPATAGFVSKIYLVVGTYAVPAWNITNTGIIGTDPNAVSFTTKNATAPGALTTSNTVTISGLGNGVTVDIYATGGAQIKIGTGTWVTATATNPLQVGNNDTVTLRINANEIEGQPVQTNVTIGGFQTTWTVITPFFTPQEPKKSVWYSEFTERLGLPIGSVVGVFKDATTVDNFGFGNLDGKLNSRFHGWIECDGRSVSVVNYPQLWESIGNVYGGTGAKSATGVYSGNFNLPDFRNSKVLGTGPIDGQAGGSPSVVTLFGPDGNGTGGATEAGSQGGYWFIDTIDDPDVDPIEQVIDGDPPVESAFFNIGQIVTTGYEDVSGSIEFNVPSSTTPGQPGNVSGTITLDKGLGVKLYETPYHQHEALSAKLDPGETSGAIAWNGAGTTTGTIAIEFGGFLNLVPQPPPNQPIDYWGWPINSQDVNPYKTSIAPGDELNGPDTWSGGGVGEINQYVTLPSGKRYAGALSPFPTVGTAKTYKSSTGSARKHSHYLALSENSDENANFSYGNSDGVGTVQGTLPAGFGSSISVLFSAEELGLEIFPGTFSLNSTTQIIPTPALSPKSKVPLVTPYFRAKWVIRAF